ncbi:MAG TPA: metal-dependent hydrolase [Acidimicrobiales bacterium]|nr:metal-dependent hydrolase [Acidimicrobiales bacterium]
MSATDVDTRVEIRPRRVRFAWDDTPLHWVHDAQTTHTINVLHLLLPAGERWFVELYRQVLPHVGDDRLRADVKGFIGQEATHARAHAAVLDHLAAQGVDTTPYTRRIEWLFDRLLGDAPLGLRVRGTPARWWTRHRLAVIAAIEHFTAALGGWLLAARAFDDPATSATPPTTGASIDPALPAGTPAPGRTAGTPMPGTTTGSGTPAGTAGTAGRGASGEAVTTPGPAAGGGLAAPPDPVMLDMLRWHAAEEVEHRAVAFELFEDQGGGYAERVLATLEVVPVMAWLWVSGTAFLMKHDPTQPGRPTVGAFRRAARAGWLPSLGELARMIPPYLRPGHHPLQDGSTAAAVAYLARSPAARAAGRGAARAEGDG